MAKKKVIQRINLSEIKDPSFLQTLNYKELDLLSQDHLQYRILRSEGLNPHFPFRAFSPCTSCDLLQHLKGALVRTEIRLVKERVCIEYCHQSYIVEMQAFKAY